jgi:hypothetical protein
MKGNGKPRTYTNEQKSCQLAGSALEAERPGLAQFPVEEASAQVIGRYKLLKATAAENRAASFLPAGIGFADRTRAF